jgi:RpiR family transcriptional regulator, carbohydrate utilization regulator
MIIAAIEAHLSALRPSEFLVANFVLGRPSVVVNMSIADIAESCAVSEPTIMRFCKALGCLGFMEFKLGLAKRCLRAR